MKKLVCRSGFVPIAGKYLAKSEVRPVDRVCERFMLRRPRGEDCVPPVTWKSAAVVGTGHVVPSVVVSRIRVTQVSG